MNPHILLIENILSEVAHTDVVNIGIATIYDYILISKPSIS